MRIFPENLATYEPNNFSISLFWTGPSDFSVEQNFVLIFLEYSETETCDAYLYNFQHFAYINFHLIKIIGKVLLFNKISTLGVLRGIQTKQKVQFGPLF